MTTPSRVYPLADDLRRSLWYVVGAALLLPLVAYVVNFWLPPPPHRLPGVLIGTGLTILAALWLCRWRVRLDEQGVTAGLPGLARTITWADLESGRIEKRHPHTLVAPARSRGRLSITLEHLSTSDRAEVWAQINERYCLPPPPSVPATLNIKYGFRRSVRCDANGVHTLVKGVPRSYGWGEVQHLIIRRIEPKRRGFSRLLLYVPQEQIDLKVLSGSGGGQRSWRGETAEVIHEYLFAKLPVEKIAVENSGQPGATRASCEQLLTEHRQQLRDTLILALTMGLLTVVGAVMTALQGEPFTAVVMALVLAPWLGFVWWFYRRAVVNVRQSEAQLRSFG